MTCRELAEQLIDYISGELAPEVHVCVEEHLRRCPSCEAYVHSYRITIRITRQLPCLDMPEHLVERLRKLLDDVGSP